MTGFAYKRRLCASLKEDGLLERKVSAYLNKRVKELGGEIRRVKLIGRRSAPDKLVMLPGAHAYVEEKRTGKGAEAAQKREHLRMARAGMRVRVIDSVEDVDRLVARLVHEADMQVGCG